jgi:hypothetical protein
MNTDSVNALAPLAANDTGAADKIWEDAPQETDRETLISGLAAMPPLDYDGQRKHVSEKLGIRLSTLDAEVAKRRVSVSNVANDALADDAPWPEPVDGAQLLDGLVAAFKRHITLPDHAAEALALWVVHTHTFMVSPITPRLNITSPEKRCGKSTCFRILQALVADPLPVANITAAAMFRIIEARHPTLLIDEADCFLGKNDGLRSIINSGHAENGNVLRWDDGMLRNFSTWSPMAIAGIGKVPSTIEDRSIVIPMRRKLRDEKIEHLMPGRSDHLKTLARKTARWSVDNTERLETANPEISEDLNDRAADNWRPLFAIADMAGSEWPHLSREAASALSGSDEQQDQSMGVKLLADIREAFAAQNADRFLSRDLCRHLAKMEDGPWCEYKHNKSITPPQLAKLLEDFGIKPIRMRASKGKNSETARGYWRDNFKEAFARYLPQPAAPDAGDTSIPVPAMPATAATPAMSPPNYLNSLNKSVKKRRKCGKRRKGNDDKK